ncbi:MAG: DUF1015 domain-containing protein [Actinomycetota bacterium]|nr:DUF1015 domain-containing protein [Actinomycetota bacterium]
MPRFEPFAGLRYDPDRVRLDDVIAPPYDVISPDERAALQAHSPYNSVRVELPDEAPGLDGYQAAAHRLTEWQAGGILRQDPGPALYGYRMSFTDEAGRQHHTVGVIGALGLARPGDGSILPHERTTPKARSDRLELLRSTQANLSPIWALSPAAGLSRSLDPAPEAVRAIDFDGVTHQLWPITEPSQVHDIVGRIGSSPVVLADGHHRYEVALAYQTERRAANDDQPGPYDLVMALVVELADEQLSVQGIHRLISGLPDGFDLMAAMADSFELEPTDPVDATIGDRMAAAGAMGLVTVDGTWLLHAGPEVTAQAEQDLDSSRLEVVLARWPEHDLVYQHGWDHAAAAVASGQASAAVLLRPVTVDQIAMTGRGGERMPPKTTFFWPKPRTGLVMREVPG